MDGSGQPYLQHIRPLFDNLDHARIAKPIPVHAHGLHGRLIRLQQVVRPRRTDDCLSVRGKFEGLPQSSARRKWKLIAGAEYFDAIHILFEGMGPASARHAILSTGFHQAIAISNTSGCDGTIGMVGARSARRAEMTTARYSYP